MSSWTSILFSFSIGVWPAWRGRRSFQSLRGRNRTLPLSEKSDRDRPWWTARRVLGCWQNSPHVCRQPQHICSKPLHSLSLLLFYLQVSRFGDVTIGRASGTYPIPDVPLVWVRWLRPRCRSLGRRQIARRIEPRAQRGHCLNKVGRRHRGGVLRVLSLNGSHIIQLLTSIPEVQAVANDYLFWVVISPLISVWSFQLDGVFIGATRSKEMRNGMIASLTIFVIATLMLKEDFGYSGFGWPLFFS